MSAARFPCPRGGMTWGMTTKRVTVSLPAELLTEAKTAVRTGAAESLSAYIADALRERLEKERGLAELERVLGGRPPVEALNSGASQPRAVPAAQGRGAVIGGRAAGFLGLVTFSSRAR